MTTAYLPFYLDPTIPPEGLEFLPHMQKKGGGRIAPEQFFDGPRQMGARIGLIFNFEDIERAPNTTLAHCLIELAPDDLKDRIVDALYDAYFQFGRDVGDPEVLLAIAAESGWQPAPTQDALFDPGLRERVEAQVQSAYRSGISGVPFFVINQKYAFSGAQPPETILNILEQVVEQETPH